MWFEEGALLLMAGMIRGKSSASCGWYDSRKERCFLRLVRFEKGALPLAPGMVRRRSATSCGWHGLSEERCLLGLVWVKEGAPGMV